jgi:hypothetical protein
MKVLIRKSVLIWMFCLFYTIGNGQSLFPFKSEGLWGYIDTNGTVIIPPTYPMAGFFYEGLAYAQLGDALGFIDVSGKEVIQPKYPAAYNFNEGFASVMDMEEWGIINTKGEMVIKPKLKHPVQFHNGLARFNMITGVTSSYGFINIKGDTVIKPIFDKTGEFSEGLCLASKGGFKYGYIDTTGKWVVQPIYTMETSIKVNGEFDYSDKNFSGGFAAVCKDEKYGVIDKNGNLVIGFKYGYIGKFSEGVAPAKKDSLYGYIDIKENWVIKPKYNDAESFHNGLAAVAKGPFLEEKWGFIDHNGKVVIPLTIFANYTFTEPMRFWNGAVPCYIEKGVYGYINRQGKIIWRMDE